MSAFDRSDGHNASGGLFGCSSSLRGDLVRRVFGSKALTVSRMPPPPDSAIRFDCRLHTVAATCSYIQFY